MQLYFQFRFQFLTVTAKKKKKKKNSYSGSSLLHVAVLNYHDCERMFIRRVSASEPRFC